MIPIFFFFIPVIIAVAPLFGARFIPTHDGEYHIIRFWQYYTMLEGGVWFPRWAPDLNNGLGIPLFTFQYPLPNVIGSFFHFFGLSFVDSVKWTLGSGYLLAVYFCFLWLRRLFGVKTAVIGAVTGAFVPYWFLDIYIRGSVGEVWAFVWIFAALYAVSTGNKLLIVLAVSLLILSHNIMAAIFVPFVFFYILITRSNTLFALFTGIGISAYFWWPAFYEQRFITGLSNVNIFDYFPQLYQLLVPSWGSGFRGQVSGGTEMSYQIGVVPLLVLGMFGFSALLKRGKNYTGEVWFVFAAAIGAIFLMTPFSRPIWQAIPAAHVIQYPWRLLSVVLVTTPLLAGAVAYRYRFGWVIAVLAVIVAFGYTRPVTYEPRTDAYYLTHESLARGTSSLGNAFQTKWISGVIDDTFREVSVSSGTAEMRQLAPTVYDVHVTATQPGTLTVPIAYYPGWKLEIGQQSIEGSASAVGLLTFPVPSGESDGVIRLGLTDWQFAAAAISILSLLTAVVSFILKK